MAIKAIVMDIDGTLLTSEKDFTKKTRQALVVAQKARPITDFWLLAARLTVCGP